MLKESLGNAQNPPCPWPFVRIPPDMVFLIYFYEDDMSPYFLWSFNILWILVPAAGAASQRWLIDLRRKGDMSSSWNGTWKPVPRRVWTIARDYEATLGIWTELLSYATGVFLCLPSNLKKMFLDELKLHPLYLNCHHFLSEAMQTGTQRT